VKVYKGEQDSLQYSTRSPATAGPFTQSKDQAAFTLPSPVPHPVIANPFDLIEISIWLGLKHYSLSRGVYPGKRLEPRLELGGGVMVVERGEWSVLVVDSLTD
jgi:hypothetical protein